MELASVVNWDEWTAIGTLILAGVTVAAVIVSVVLAVREGRHAAAEVRRSREREERDRLVDLLLRLSKAVGEIGFSTDPNTPAMREARVLLAALPDDLAVIVRAHLDTPTGSGARFACEPAAKLRSRAEQGQYGPEVDIGLDVSLVSTSSVITERPPSWTRSGR